MPAMAHHYRTAHSLDQHLGRDPGLADANSVVQVAGTHPALALAVRSFQAANLAEAAVSGMAWAAMRESAIVPSLLHSSLCCWRRAYRC